MAYQLTPGGLWVPPWHVYGSGGTITVAAYQINSAAEYVAAIIRAPKTGTLDQFEFRTSTIPTFPGNGLRCSFQDVDLSTGLPDGTADQFRVIAASPGANTWVAPGLITDDGTDTGAKRSVTAGDHLACVIDFNPTYTTGDILLFHAGSMAHTYGFPYNVLNGVRASSENIPLIALKYNDGSYPPLPGIYPFAAHNAHAFNTGSAADEIGLIFQFPVPVKVNGCWLRVAISNDADLVLYDSDGSTPLQTLSVDASVRGQTGGTISLYPFAAEVTLAAATSYRLVLKPTTGSNVTVYSFDVAAAAMLDMVAGQNFHYTARADAGAWSQTTTRMPWIGLMVTAIDDAGGGGGGNTGPLVGPGGLAG